DDDRRGEALEDVDVRPGEGGHEALHERRVGLVDHPLRLAGARVAHQRALAGARDAGGHGRPARGCAAAAVLEVVLPRALHSSQVVPVGGVAVLGTALRLGPRGGGHLASVVRGRRLALCYLSPWPGEPAIITRRPGSGLSSPPASPAPRASP